MNNKIDDPLESGLEGVSSSASVIAAELRLMAAGEGNYSRLSDEVSPWIKNIWSAAADMIERAYKTKLN